MCKCNNCCIIIDCCGCIFTTIKNIIKGVYAGCSHSANCIKNIGRCACYICECGCKGLELCKGCYECCECKCCECCKCCDCCNCCDCCCCANKKIKDIDEEQTNPNIKNELELKEINQDKSKDIQIDTNMNEIQNKN